MKTKLLFLAISFLAISMTAQHANYWTAQNTGFADESRAASVISVVDNNVVWVRAHDGTTTTNNIQEFALTTDGGATWTTGNINVGDTNAGIAMIHGISATTAWAVAFPKAGSLQGIFKTTDAGATWVEQPTAAFSGAGAFANVVYFWDENKGFCQGDPVGGYYELYTTDDGGDNWTRVPSANIPAPTAGEYGYTSQIFATGNALWWTTNKGRIYRSYDFGHTFEVFQSPLTDFGGSAVNGEIAFSNDNNGYLVSNTREFYTTADGGATWDMIFPDTGSTFGGSVACIPGTNFVITTGAATDARGSSYSIDGGTNFVDICDDQHLSVRFSENGAGWSGSFSSVADGGGIYKYTGPIAGISENHIDGFVSFPNPVQNIYTIGAMENISSVTVYNMIGQEVHTATPNAVTYQIDMSTLPHGTYIVNVSTVDGSYESLKVVK